MESPYRNGLISFLHFVVKAFAHLPMHMCTKVWPMKLNTVIQCSGRQKQAETLGIFEVEKGDHLVTMYTSSTCQGIWGKIRLF